MFKKAKIQIVMGEEIAQAQSTRSRDRRDVTKRGGMYFLATPLKYDIRTACSPMTDSVSKSNFNLNDAGFLNRLNSRNFDGKPLINRNEGAIVINFGLLLWPIVGALMVLCRFDSSSPDAWVLHIHHKPILSLLKICCSFKSSRTYSSCSFHISPSSRPLCWKSWSKS
jgi:hypothetical protein